jgi:hypothetical protein
MNGVDAVEGEQLKVLCKKITRYTAEYEHEQEVFDILLDLCNIERDKIYEKDRKK